MYLPVNLRSIQFTDSAKFESSRIKYITHIWHNQHVQFYRIDFNRVNRYKSLISYIMSLLVTCIAFYVVPVVTQLFLLMKQGA